MTRPPTPPRMGWPRAIALAFAQISCSIAAIVIGVWAVVAASLRLGIEPIKGLAAAFFVVVFVAGVAGVAVLNREVRP